MKFMYDNQYRSFGRWNKEKKEKEVSLSELANIYNELENTTLDSLLIDGIDLENQIIHLVRYDTDY